MQMTNGLFANQKWAGKEVYTRWELDSEEQQSLKGRGRSYAVLRKNLVDPGVPIVRTLQDKVRGKNTAILFYKQTRNTFA